MGGKSVKEGFRSFPFRKVINEVVPVGEPMLPCACDNRGSAIFHGVHRPHCLLPPQSSSKRQPEMGIHERFCHGDDEGGCIIFARPHRVFAVGAHIIRFHPISSVYMVAPFRGFGHRLLNRHRCSPVISPLLVGRDALMVRSILERGEAWR
jgi:hypothetical protein